MAIDAMNRPFYCIRRKEDKELYGIYEFNIMARSTFAGVLKRLELKPGEEWKLVTMMGKGSLEGMLQEMDEVGIERTLIDPMIGWSRHDQKLWGNYSIETLAELAEKSKGRVVAGAGYNPFRIMESLEEIERAVKDLGFKFVWAHPISFGLAPNDKKMYPLYIKGIELGIPICIQVGQSAEPLPSEVGHPMYADEVAMDFPDLTLVLTHTGWPWTQEWISMVWKHPNVYGNIGAYMPSDLDPALVRFMDGRGQDKVFWATNGLGTTRCKKEFMELPLKDETRRKVLRENARRVFKL
ncbi:MAG: putative TIM-barrel fold metal-dependent hydrolase [Dehalococcoidia bacterium]|nr:putative TIM-barrel fold metal-dependent hydrolase [Dehalococcoidia bacterium]